MSPIRPPGIQGQVSGESIQPPGQGRRNFRILPAGIDPKHPRGWGGRILHHHDFLMTRTPGVFGNEITDQQVERGVDQGQDEPLRKPCVALIPKDLQFIPCRIQQCDVGESVPVQVPEDRRVQRIAVQPADPQWIFDGSEFPFDTALVVSLVDQKNIREFSIKASDEFWITDATFLENGDLVILERRFGWSIGLDMRIRRFDGSKIAPGATLDGEVLMQASLTDGIDNMEGISAWTNGRGQTVLSVISDDNFKSFQRTILLEFVLNEKGQS